MTFENAVAGLHENLFLREFTFSTATFVPSGGTQLELADSIIAIGSEVAIVQVKERVPPAQTTPHRERKWFRKKVLGDATRQIRDTVRHLHEQEGILVSNGLGLPVELSTSGRNLHAIVLYRAADLLPTDSWAAKHHMSRSVGLIHVFDSTDYLHVATTLVTPREFFDYLAFRSDVIGKWGDVPGLPEQALLGQYLSGQLGQRPDVRFSWFVTDLIDDRAEWDMSKVMRTFGDHVTSISQPQDYYLVLLELAELTRTELREFKQRFDLSVRDATTGRIVQPYRMAIPRRNCGFAFMSLSSDQVPFAREALEKLTLAHKYEQKLEKCIGMAVWREGREFAVLWSYTNYAWQHELELERFVAESGVLSRVRNAEIPLYRFGASGTDRPASATPDPPA